MVYDNGSLYHPSILDITDADIRSRFIEGAAIVTMISLAIGYPTKTSVPHMITNAFRYIWIFYKWIIKALIQQVEVEIIQIRCEPFVSNSACACNDSQTSVTILIVLRNLLAISVATDYTFKESAEIKEMLSDPTKLLALAAAAAAEAAPAAEAAVEEVSFTDSEFADWHNKKR